MKKYGLVGKNLKYSHSKFIHEYLIDYYNIDATYDLIEIPAFNKDVLYRYDGLNITIPYKQDVIEFLDLNKSKINAINTILNIDNKLTGYNTDIDGFALLVEKLALNDIKKIVILGSGATSLMVKEYFKNKEIVVVSRSSKVYNYENLDNLSADLLVNTTPVGMIEYVSPIDEKLLINYRGVIDLNYNPFNSKLSNDCKKNNVKFINGLYMLIKQACNAFEIWHDLKIENNLIEKIYNKLLFKNNKKIALMGMPLSGKTRIIRKYGGCDLDEEIISTFNESIEQMLKNNTFRDRETIVLEKLVKDNKSLIALGGGCILKHQNVEILKDYLLVYLKVDLEVLFKRLEFSHRPLLKSKEDLKKTYENRKDLYNKYANVILTKNDLEELLNENRNN